MPSHEAVIEEAVGWFRGEAARYVAIAQDHAERAQLMATGSDRVAINPRRRQQLHEAAVEAARIAHRFLQYAVAIRVLAPSATARAAQRGEVVHLPATFLRPCSAEDYPGEGLFRLPGGGDVVRAPLVWAGASRVDPAHADLGAAPAQQDRWP